MTYEVGTQMRTIGEFSEVINSVADPIELSADTTAVVTFFMPAEQAVSVEDIFDQANLYMKATQVCRATHLEGHLSADFRKVFWCTQLGEWKLVNFYFNTNWLNAALHGNDRELLEPYMGKHYRCDGTSVGRLWSETQSVINGCIKLCDISLDDGIKKYETNLMEIQSKLSKLLQ